jgi:integrase
LTGARVGEVAGLSRAELDRIDDHDRAAWLIPGTRTKNGRDHLIPLSATAREHVLALLELLEADEPFLFPTRSRGRDGPMRSNSLTQAMGYFVGRLSGEGDAVQSWKAEPPTPHDLRRTVGTRLAELRVVQEIRDRVLNHIPTDVGSKHYNVYDFADEKRDALNLWADTLVRILANRSGADPIAVEGGGDDRD